MLNKNFEVMEKGTGVKNEKEVFKKQVSCEFYSSGQMCHTRDGTPIIEDETLIYKRYMAIEDDPIKVNLEDRRKYLQFVIEVGKTRISNISECCEPLDEDKLCVNISAGHAAINYIKDAMGTAQMAIDEYAPKIHDTNFDRKLITDTQDLVELVDELIKSITDAIDKGCETLPGTHRTHPIVFKQTLYLPGMTYVKPEKNTVKIYTQSKYTKISKHKKKKKSRK
jgi:hypothetical protein